MSKGSTAIPSASILFKVLEEANARSMTGEFLVMTVGEEVEHLAFGADGKTKPVLTTLHARCRGDAGDVLAKTKEVLKSVIDCELSFDDPVEDWEAVLPRWFVAACSPEISVQDVEKLLRANPQLLEEMWTVSGFIYWFRPENRSWFWWDGKTENSENIIIDLLTPEFPFTYGALYFLLSAAGAKSVTMKY